MYSGSSRSDMRNRVFSDVWGITMFAPENAEITAQGAPICGAVVADYHSSPEEAVKYIVRIQKSYEPNMQTDALMGEFYTSVILS